MNCLGRKLKHVSYTNLELVKRQLAARFYLNELLDSIQLSDAILDSPGFFVPKVNAEYSDSNKLFPPSTLQYLDKLSPRDNDSWSGWISLNQTLDYPWLSPSSRYYEVWIQSIVIEYPDIAKILPSIQRDAQNGSAHQIVFRDLLMYQKELKLEKNLVNNSIISASQVIGSKDYQFRESHDTYQRYSEAYHRRYLKKNQGVHLPNFRISRRAIKKKINKSLYSFLQRSQLLKLVRPILSTFAKYVNGKQKSR